MGKLRRFTFYKLKWIKWLQLGLMLLIFHGSLAHDPSYLNRSNRIGFEILKKDQKNEIASREKYSYDVKQKLPKDWVNEQKQVAPVALVDEPHFFFFSHPRKTPSQSPKLVVSIVNQIEIHDVTSSLFGSLSIDSIVFIISSNWTIPFKGPNSWAFCSFTNKQINHG